MGPSLTLQASSCHTEGEKTKREEIKVATLVALADGWGKKNSNEDPMSMGFF
jgi:hypothetical protein